MRASTVHLRSLFLLDSSNTFGGTHFVEGCARDRSEAVETARRECPDPTPMDIGMPVMDGLTATRLLRQVEELCGVVIVAFSAFTGGGNCKETLAAGRDALDNKRWGINEVAAAVRRFPPAA